MSEEAKQKKEEKSTKRTIKDRNIMKEYFEKGEKDAEALEKKYW